MDVGQPEFTFPDVYPSISRQSLYLAHLFYTYEILKRSFFYGDITPKSDPGMYCQGVEARHEYFQQTHGLKKAAHYLIDGCPEIPLIINTHGWLKGVGYDVLANGYVSPYLYHNSVAIEGTGSVALKKAYEKFAKSPKRTC